MTLRDKCTHEELKAHQILDAVAENFDVDCARVEDALATLGESIEDIRPTPVAHRA